VHTVECIIESDEPFEAPEEEIGTPVQSPPQELPPGESSQPPSSLPHAPTPGDGPINLPGPIYDSGECEAQFFVMVNLRTSGVSLADLVSQIEVLVLVLEDFAGTGLCLIRDPNQVGVLLHPSSIAVDLNITFAVQSETEAFSLLTKFEDASSLSEVLEALKTTVFPEIQGINFVDGSSESNVQAPSDGLQDTPSNGSGDGANQTVLYVLVSIGVLLAIALVCAGVFLYRKQYRKHSVHVI